MYWYFLENAGKLLTVPATAAAAEQIPRTKTIEKEIIMKLRIGENIKFLRKAADITQETLAEMLGVSCQSVSRWELGAC